MMQDSSFRTRSPYVSGSLALAGLLLLGACATDGSLPAAPENAALSVTPAFEQAAAQVSGDQVRAEVLLREAGPLRRPVYQTELLTLLSRPDIPEQGRLWLIRSLALVAGPESVPALVSLCRDPRWCNAAVDTLVRVPGEDAEVAILRALSDEFCTVRLPLVLVAERRMMQGAVPVLATLARGEEEALAEACIRTLGTIGSQGAYQALRALHVRPEFVELRVRALVAALARIAGSRTAPGELRASAIRSCREILAGNWPAPLRCSSLQSLALFAGSAASPELFSALRGEDAALCEAAISAVIDARYSDLSAVIASGCSGLPLTVHKALLEAFAKASDPVARELAFSELSSADSSLRAAGVRVLVNQCKAADVPRLLRLIEAQGDNASEAATVLSRLSDPQVDVALRERLGGASPALAAVLLEISGTRHDRAVFEPACIALESGLAADPSLRSAAFEALRLLALPEDSKRLLALLSRLESASEIQVLTLTLRSLAATPADREALELALRSLQSKR